jgi:hypothetical protein
VYIYYYVVNRVRAAGGNPRCHEKSLYSALYLHLTIVFFFLSELNYKYFLLQLFSINIILLGRNRLYSMSELLTDASASSNRAG